MEKEIVFFDLAKINRGKEKLCKCNPPCYEVDSINRIVMCLGCGAVVDAMDALITFIECYEKLEDCQRKMLSKAKAYEKMANDEFQRMIKNRVFRNMDNQYKSGLLPICPVCNKDFDPTEITNWTRRM